MAQLNNPEIQNLVTNPQAMSAMMQIQQGMEQLRQVAPSFATTYDNFSFYNNRQRM
jgi:ubiquilin